MSRNNTDKSLQRNKQPLAQRVKKEVQHSWPMYIMLLPAIILALIFCYAPMGGLIMAFQNYKPWLGITGSEFIVAINKDEDATTFEYSDVGIVGNATEAIKVLIEEVKKIQAQ